MKSKKPRVVDNREPQPIIPRTAPTEGTYILSLMAFTFFGFVLGVLAAAVTYHMGAAL